jgi:hypothetical protein
MEERMILKLLLKSKKFKYLGNSVSNGKKKRQTFLHKINGIRLVEDTWRKDQKLNLGCTKDRLKQCPHLTWKPGH